MKKPSLPDPLAHAAGEGEKVTKSSLKTDPSLKTKSEKPLPHFVVEGEHRRDVSSNGHTLSTGGERNGARPEQYALTAEITQRLEVLYGVQQWRAGLAPLDELVACILSQHTSDINSGRAFERLRATYPTWEAVIAAPTTELADVIRCGGLANSKAPRIQNVLRAIEDEHGRITLDFLETLSDADARAYLMSLPGVGPKTAAIVLCFAMGRNALPVDTHVFRVAWRLGLIEKKIGEAKAHDALQAQVTPEMTYRFHVALITHGRQVCKAPTPRCTACPLTDLCRYYQEHYTASQK